MAYDDSVPYDHQITSFDPLQPVSGGACHSFPAGTSIEDGRTTSVYGLVTTTPADRGVNLFAGGTVGTVPATGAVFRLIAPDGTVLHELCSLPASAFMPVSGIHIFVDGDQTRALLLAPRPLSARLLETAAELPAGRRRRAATAVAGWRSRGGAGDARVPFLDEAAALRAYGVDKCLHNHDVQVGE